MAGSETDGLLAAVQRGDETAVRAALDAGAPADGRDWAGVPVLARAVQTGHVGIVKLLLERGARATPRQRGEYPPIFGALRHGDQPALLQVLLDAGASPLATWNGSTTVMEAARLGDLALVQRLIALGVDPAARTSEGCRTALDHAVEHRHARVSKYLRSLGVPELQGPMRRFVTELRRRHGGKATACSDGYVYNPRTPGARTQVNVDHEGYRVVLVGTRSLSTEGLAALNVERDDYQEYPDGVGITVRGHDADLASRQLEQLVGLATRTGAERPPPVPANRIRIGAKIKAADASRGSRHVWGGARDPPVICGGCGSVETPLARFDLRDAALAPLGLKRTELVLTWCLDCGDWGPFHDPPLEPPDPSDGDAAVELLEPRAIALTPLKPGSRCASFAGGEPDWLQLDGTPDCPRCSRAMRFILQLGTVPEIAFGDGGRLYAFTCDGCGGVATLIQSH